MIKKITPLAAVAATFLLPLVGHAQNSMTYNGNGANGFGGTLGSGSLTISSDPTGNGGSGTVTFTLTPSGTFNSNDVVVYIDSMAGGFSNTSTFNDQGDGGRTAISGVSSNGRTQATFASGFGADYAVGFQNNTFTGVFGLASGGNNSLNYITGNTPTSGGPYAVTVNDSDLGLTSNGSIKFVATLISTDAYRSNEAIGNIGNVAANPGYTGPITFSDYQTFSLSPTSEPGSLMTLLLGAALLGGIVVARRRRGVTA